MAKYTYDTNKATNVVDTANSRTNQYIQQGLANTGYSPYEAIDGDTLAIGRLQGFDTAESTAGLEMNKKAGKLLDKYNIPVADQKRIGLQGKHALQEYMKANPNIELEHTDYDVYGRPLLQNKVLTEYMLTSGAAVPTDRYDQKAQQLFHTANDKRRKLFGDKEAGLFEAQRQYNLDATAPGLLESAKNIPKGLLSNTQQVVAGIGDFVLDVVTPRGNNTLLDKAKSAESADANFGYDNKEMQFRTKEAVHAFKQGDYTTAIKHAAVMSPEGFANSVPYIAAMFVPGTVVVKGAQLFVGAARMAKVAGALEHSAMLKSVAQVANKNAGFGMSVGMQTNNDMEEYTKNNGGVEPSPERVAGMTALNTLQMATDKFVFKDIFSKTGTASKLTDMMSKSMKVLDEPSTLALAKVVAKAGISVAEEGTQEYLQQWATILNQKLGTEKYGDFNKLLRNPEVLDEALGAGIMGAGIGGTMSTMHSTPDIYKNVKAGIDPLLDTLAGVIPKETKAETQRQEMAGVEQVPTEISAVDKPHYDEFTEHMKVAKTAETNVERLQAIQEAKVKIASMEDPLAQQQAIEVLSKHIMESTPNTEKLYKLHEKLVTKGESISEDEVLGSREELANAFRTGISFDSTSEEKLVELADALGIDQKETTKYLTEQKALGSMRKFEAVEQDTTTGTRGVVTQYQQLKKAQAVGDTALVNETIANLQHFKNTQIAKANEFEMLMQQANESGERATSKTFKRQDGETYMYAEPEIKGMEKSNPAKRIVAAARATAQAIETILRENKVETQTNSKPKEEVSTETKVKTPSEPKEATTRTETKVETKESTEVVKDIAKAKEESVARIQDGMFYEQGKKDLEISKSKGTSIGELQGKSKKVMEVVTKHVSDVVAKVVKEYGKTSKNSTALNMLKESPARMFLNDTGKFDTKVVEAIALGIQDYVANNLSETKFNEEIQIQKMFGMNDSTVIPPLVKKEMQYIGRFHKLEATKIGKTVLRHIGMKTTKDADVFLQERLEADLGAIAIAVMEKQGLIQYSNETLGVAKYNHLKRAIIEANEGNGKSFESEEVVGIETDKVAIPMVRMVESDRVEKYVKNSRESMKDIQEQLGIESDTKGPRTKKRTKDREHKVRGYEKETKIPAEQLRVLNQLENRKWSAVVDRIENLEKIYGKHEAKVLEMFGWKDPKMVHIDKREDTAHKNNTIKKALESVFEFKKEVGTNPVYFDWFFSKNGRFFMDSVSINPQTNKIHRFLVTEANVETTVNSGSKREVFKLAVVQAFDGSSEVQSMEDPEVMDKLGAIDKQSAESSMKDFDKLVKEHQQAILDVKEDRLESESVVAAIGKTDHPVHALMALEELGKYKEDGEFKTSMILETDAITSGFQLGLLVAPVMQYEKLKKWLAKGGIWLGGTEYKSYGEYREKSGDKDSYETSAEGVKKIMEGKPNRLGSWIVVNRKFMKAPFMTFIYGSSIDNIKRSIGLHYADDMIDMLSDPKTVERALETLRSAEIQVPFQLGKDVSEKALEKVAGQYRELSLDSKLAVGTILRTIHTKLSKQVEETYGEAVGEYLNSEFGEVVALRKNMNKAYVHMFQAFKDEYDEKIKDKTTKAEYEAVLEEMMNEGKVPGIFTVNSKSSAEKMVVANKVPVNNQKTASKTKVQSKLTDGQRTLHPLIREMVEAPASGAVLGIHWLDGSIMTQVLRDNGGLGVHDAVVSSVENAIKTAKDYSKATWEMTQKYDLVGSILRELDDVRERTTNRHIKSSIGKTYDELERLHKIVQKNKTKMKEDAIAIEHMSLPGSMYTEGVMKPKIELGLDGETQDKLDMVKSKVSPEAMDAIMTVLNKFKDCK